MAAEWILPIFAIFIIFMAIANLIKSGLYWHNVRQHGHRSLVDKLSPAGFYVSLLGHLIAFWLPIGYFVTIRHLNILVISLLTANSIYWVGSGISLITMRFEPKITPQIPIFHALFVLVELMPVFLSPFHLGFPKIDLHSSYTELYLIHILVDISLFVIEVKGWTRPVLTDSSYGIFVKRTQSIIIYMWPKGQIVVRLQIIGCFVLIVIGRVINLVSPLYVKWIVDSLSGEHPRFCYDLISIALFLKFLQGSGAMGGFLNTIRLLLWLGVQQYTTLSIESDVFRHLHSLPLNWHLQRKSGEVMKIIDRGTSSINDFLNYLLFNIGPTIADIIVAIVFFISMFNILFGVLVLCTMIIYMGLTLYLTQWRIKYRRDMNAADNNASAVAMDSLLNYETVKYYGNEDLEYKRYKEAIEDYQMKERKSIYSLQFLNAIQNSILGLSMLIGSLMMAYNISREGSKLSAGDYVLFSTYIIQLSVPLNFLGTVYSVLQRSFLNMENLFELFEEPSEDRDAGHIETITEAAPIEFRNVSFGYLPNIPILKNISFTVPAHKTVAIVGPSGSGKSTIIRLIYRLYNIQEGELLIGDTKYADLSLKAIRKNMGVVPQDTVLFNETIEYNIRYGRPTASFNEIEEVSRRADLHNFITSHPDGYACKVGERGLKLSGGEKQRVAIARTLLKNPNYILLDEATSSLDARTEKVIQESLSKLCKEKTVLVVAHRLSTIVNSDLILVLNKGEIIESGTHKELTELGGMYSQMWKIQSETPE